MDASGRMEAFEYRILPSDPRFERLELHVFARAYRDSWIALYSQPPSGRHWFERLGFAIEFYAPG